MKILFIDTSSKLAHVYVSEDGKNLSEETNFGEKTHSVELMPMVERAMNKAKFRMKDIDLVAATNGPGSYTGIRISLATAKMLAYGADIPLVPVNSLDFIGESAAADAPDDEKSAIFVPMLDARNRQVYYKLNGEHKAGDVTEICKAIRDNGDEKIIFCGDGAVNNADIISEIMSGKNFVILDSESSKGSPEGAYNITMKIFNGTPDKEAFNPANAFADYIKDVHITEKKK